ncbi:MAG: hypothetical protein JWM16_2563 [Verrucomicrobiales bacterium]|nr:hypothetical protein [Verrucomicrobiales bacterium]
MSEVTPVLDAIGQGNPSAAHQLLPLIYEELRKLTAQRMAGEAAGYTLQPTALVDGACWTSAYGLEQPRTNNPYEQQ